MIRFDAWRLHRKGLVGFGVAGFALAFFYALAYKQAAGSTAASQAEFGRAISLTAGQFAFLVPAPVHPETLGGYVQWKLLAFMTDLLMVWAALAGVWAARGDEDRGLVERWLASGVSRTRLLLARTSAFALVALAVCLVTTLGVSVGAPLAHQDPNLAGELGKGLSMAAGVFAAYALSLFAAQLPAERQTATALGVGLLVVLLVVNGLADTVKSAAGLGVITPFHWLEKTTSGAPGGTFDVGATLALVIAGAFFVAASIPVFEGRDLGAGLISWGRRSTAAVRTASRNVMLRAPFLEGLWEQRTGLLVWMAGTFVLAAVMVAVTKSVADALLAIPGLDALFRQMFSGPVYAGFLGFIWFGIALLLLAGYSVVQVSRWAAQDQEGRVEMLLSAPVSRTRVVVDRALEFAIASLLIVGSGYVGVAVKAPAAGLGLDPGRVLLASALLWPFALAFGGLGVAVASRWPRIAVPFLAAFAVVEYFLGDLAPLFKLPDWSANLSVFHLYGNPIDGSLSWGPTIAMAAVFVAGFGAALVLLRRRDVAGA